MTDIYQPTSDDIGKTACVIATSTNDGDGNITSTARIEMLTDEEVEKLSASGNFADLLQSPEEQANVDCDTASEDCCEAIPSTNPAWHSPAFLQGYEQGKQEAARDFDYRNNSLRQAALGAAIQYLDRGKDASTVVSFAKTFHAFLKGE